MSAPKNIAIIAVHGVGDHEERSSASAISRLLLRIPRSFRTQYTSFSESTLGIATAPVPEAERPAEPQRRVSRISLDERPERVAGSMESPPNEGLPPDVRFMRDQLRDYRPDPAAATYETVRIEGKHLEPHASGDAESSTPDARIHVYEMYWADIARIGNSFLSIFGTFYQVVIHLPYVGLITLEESKATSADGDGWWEAWLTSYRVALRCMTLIAPTLNIMMVAVGLGALVLRIPPGSQRVFAYAIPAVLVLIGGTRIMYKLRGERSMFDVLIPMILGAVVFFIGRSADGPIRPEMAMIAEWWIIAAVPLALIFRAFDRNRPFAWALAIATYIAVTGLMAWYAYSTGQDTTKTILAPLEWLNLALLATWFIFATSTLFVAVFGLIVPLVASKPKRRPQVKRAGYTARFALAFPGIAFAAVTLTIGGALVAGQGKSVFRGQTHYNSVFTYPSLARHRAQDTDIALKRIGPDSTALATQGLPDSAAHVRTHAMERIATFNGPAYFLRTFGGSADGLPGLLGTVFIGFALILAVWVLIPVLIAEFRSPPLDRASRQTADFTTDSMELGTWLSTAFRVARGSGEILVAVTIGSVVGIAIAAPTVLLHIPVWLASLADKVKPMHFGYTEIGGWVVGASAVGLYALVTRLSSFGARLRPAFGIMADIDNYLRELPTDRTPRAKLAERFTSLLRYLCLWRVDNEQRDAGYDAIIIVAHSQGTIISADLLRYLKHFQAGTARFEPHLARLQGDQPKLPIILMTMGSPLRQIYGQRFPDIYGWVGGASDAATGGPASPEVESLLGVAAWINLYRSGDYVGRSVWRTKDTAEVMYDPTKSWSERNRRRAEACLGPGAHTHYWDETAEVVALAIDSVIREVISGDPQTIDISRTMEILDSPQAIVPQHNVMPTTAPKSTAERRPPI